MDGGDLLLCDGGAKNFPFLPLGGAGGLPPDLGRELDLSAALEDAIAAAEMQLDPVRAAEVRGDLGLPQRPPAARAVTALDLGGEGTKDHLVHRDAP